MLADIAEVRCKSTQTCIGRPRVTSGDDIIATSAAFRDITISIADGLRMRSICASAASRWCADSARDARGHLRRRKLMDGDALR